MEHAIMMMEGSKSLKIEHGKFLHCLVNGKPFLVEDPDIGTSLNTWLRTTAKLTGAKTMCKEGGCGSCVVMVTRADPVSGKDASMAVNSCLFPLLCADGCQITTSEGLVSDGGRYNAIQKRMAHFNATQCGYCTPGFIMTMYSLLSKNPSPTQEEIEAEFDGNICRCTGFRAIFDAMKSFAKDADPKLGRICADIEDIKPCQSRCLKDDGICCRKSCGKYHADGTAPWLHKRSGANSPYRANSLLLRRQSGTGSAVWFRPSTLQQLTEGVKSWVSERRSQGVRFVVGNTSTGVFKNEGPYSVYCDTKLVKEFHKVKDTADALEIGANVTLAQLISEFEKRCSECHTFATMAKHIRKVANVPVRNVASWAGNLIMKKMHPEFTSDIFTLFEAFSVKLVICDCVTALNSIYELVDKNGFMALDITGKVILSAVIPKFSVTGVDQCKTVSYKVMPRSQNAHAYVNAAFFATVSCEKIVDARIVFGGISNVFVHASKTEKYLQRKDINSQEVLEGALKVLESELKPESYSAADSSPGYRKSLSLGLFYKFYLSLCDEVSSEVGSAVDTIQRPLTKATQSYDSKASLYPVTQPIPTLTGIKQSSGEAMYLSDLSSLKDELFATFVMAKVGNADIDSIDTNDAETLPGFHRIISASDLPPELKNTYTPAPYAKQCIIAESHVDFAGQPIAIVLADSQEHADLIADAVIVTYENRQPVVCNLGDAIEKRMFFDGAGDPVLIGDTEKAIKNAPKKISGRIKLGSQYHFYMETQIARAKPTEDGFDIECATQAQDKVQRSLAYIFGWNCNRFNVTTGRMGGSFGGKLNNSLLTASIATVASYISGMPVRFHANLNQCMETFGSRPAYVIDYNVGFTDDGLLQGIDVTYYTNSGVSPNNSDANTGAIRGLADSGYFCPNWRLASQWVKTHIASNTWCRAPMTAQLTMCIETILEHVAKSIDADPIEVKQKNLYVKNQRNLIGDILTYCNLRKLSNSLLSSAKVQERQNEITAFNIANKWKKRGLGFTPMKYAVSYTYSHYSTQVSIFHADGSVVLTSGGADSGQGLNTKLVQVASHVLGVPMDLIRVKDSMITTTPNSSETSSSISSELCCQGVLECCKILKSRIVDAKEKLGLSEKISWPDLIGKCFAYGVDLTAHYWVFHKPKNYVQYNCYGAACSEAELDVITGEFVIRRVDILYDCGQSINPEIDVGQAEGAFLMGVGFHTMEKMMFNPLSGQLVTNNTWSYKVPSSKDIPTEWNMTFLKDAPNPNGILSAKAVGEPPLCLSASVVFALKRCIEAYRKDKSYFAIDLPATIDNIQQLCDVAVSDFNI